MRQSHWRRPGFSRSACVAIVLAASTMLAGCGRTAVRQVNEVALTHRVSATDDASRVLAAKTLALLPQRYADYRIGPDDVLAIGIFEWESRDQTRTVELRIPESGAVALALIGEIQVGGLTVEEARSLIAKRLQEQGILHSPRVSVSVKEYRSKRVALVGALRNPGVFTLRQNVATLLEALTLAGGVSESAGHVLYVVRTAGEPSRAEAGEPADATGSQVIAVDLIELLEEGNLDLNVVLRDGDVVNVPPAQKFYVVGLVRQPGGFPLNRPTTVFDAIALAGGLREDDASPHACVLKRRTADGESSVGVDLVEISRGRRPNFYLMPNDVLEVRQTAGKRAVLHVLDAFKALFKVSYGL